MPEIGTFGLMSGDGKRGVAERPKLPRPSSTLPSRHFAGLQNWVAIRAERTWPNLLPAQLGRE